MANKKLTSIRTDVIPHLVLRQGQSNSYLLENVAGLTHRKRPLQVFFFNFFNFFLIIN